MLLPSEIKKLESYLATQPVKKAFLFGSYARNQETRDSDLDLLIEIEPGHKIGLVKFISMKLDLEEIFQRKVDLLEEGGVSKHLAPVIESEKKLIYEKQQNT